MKKIILLSSALLLLSSYAANAQLSIQATVGEPVYYAPSPGYVQYAPDYPSEHYDRHRHKHNDYWAHRGWEERHGHEDHGRHEGWDHDR